MTGVYGKLPAHGDFVRRGLPQSFVQPWDAWLQAGITAAHSALGPAFDAQWAAMPAWRFHLPPGLCGPDAMAGVLMPSADRVGRRFPLTIAALVDDIVGPPGAPWFEALEAAAVAACELNLSIDDLASSLPGVPGGEGSAAEAPVWWTADGQRVASPVWPSAPQFLAMLGTHRARPVVAIANAGDADADADAAGPVAEASTHAGVVRSRNEDAYVARADIGLWVVADGAGGHGAGDVASGAVAQALTALPAELTASEVLAQVRLRLAEVHDALHRCPSGPSGMTPVTTVVAMMVRDGHFACLWAGDSRAYLLRDGALVQLTRDHSLLQELLDAGAVRPEDAETHPHANVITRAIGGPDTLVLDKIAGRLQAKDCLLLCSDGLFKELSETRIGELLAAGDGSQVLIDACLKAGARDNVTAVVIRA